MIPLRFRLDTLMKAVAGAGVASFLAIGAYRRKGGRFLALGSLTLVVVAAIFLLIGLVFEQQRRNQRRNDF